MIRTLLFSTLYPSCARPTHGIFVETRLRHLLSTREVETKVVAPVPWFPSAKPCFGNYARFAATPERETWNGFDVWHPRYLLPPKVGMNIAPFTLAMGARGAVARILESGFEFDLIDAHYYYPDGVAAAILARHFGKPFVITARGTDLSLIPRHSIPRSLIGWAERNAAASITVCQALADALVNLGAERERIHVMRNGVDLEVFKPIDRRLARKILGWPDVPTLLSVGHLVEVKGHHVTVEALTDLPEFRLVVVGEGKERTRLMELAGQAGVANRVEFVGRVKQQRLKYYYSAADAMVLASSREGWANVLLESMACGTPVVATPVWGTPEVVREPVAGVLARGCYPKAIAAAVQDLIARPRSPSEVRRYAEGFNWGETSQEQLRLFRATAAARTSLPAHVRSQDKWSTRQHDLS